MIVTLPFNVIVAILARAAIPPAVDNPARLLSPRIIEALETARIDRPLLEDDRKMVPLESAKEARELARTLWALADQAKRDDPERERFRAAVAEIERALGEAK